MPREYKFAIIDSWLGDEVSLDAIDGEYSHFGKERIKAFSILEAGNAVLT